MDPSKAQLEFIDRLYAVAMEPERFTELVDIWHSRLREASRDESGTLAEDMQTLEAHLRRAESLFSLVTSQESLLPTPLLQRLQAEPQAMFAIDQDGKIRGHNEAARAVFGLADDEDCAQLPIQADAITTIRGELERLEDQAVEDYEPQLLRTWRRDSEQSVVLSLSVWMSGGGRRLLVVRSVDFSWPERLSPVVQKAFGLTRAEVAVMRLLAEGSTAADIAEQRHASLATVRSQIRSIYGKTSTRNQSEFMRMALGLAAIDTQDPVRVEARFGETCAQQSPHPRPAERSLMRLEDGRVLDYSDYGDPEGRVCMYLHSEFFGDAMTASMGSKLGEAGLRVIAPARPGNGRSSLLPDPQQAHRQFAEDCLTLLDHLGIERCVHFSFMAGTAYSLELAELAPERAVHIVVLAPTFPFDVPEAERELPYFHRVLAGILKSNERLLEFLCRSGMAFQNRAGTRRFFETFAKSRPIDLALVRDDAVFPALEHGARLCAAQGHVGFFNDYRAPISNAWSRFVRLPQPISVLVGDHASADTATPFRQLQKARSGVEIVEAPQGAHYLLFSNEQQVVDLLTDAWAGRATRRNPDPGDLPVASAPATLSG